MEKTVCTAPEPMLEEEFVTKPIFDSLEKAKIEYCLLRGLDELYSTEGDLEIDLLIHPKQYRVLAQTVAGLGFLESPSLGHYPHKFFISFDEHGGHWIKLDVVTALYYGDPIRRYRVDLLDECLSHRRKESVYVLAPEHEFITLFLHALLDKPRIKPSQRERLKALRLEIEKDKFRVKKVGRYIDNFCSPFLDWDYLKRVFDEDDWEGLRKHRPAIARRFFFNQPITSFYRSVMTRLTRKMRPLYFALRRHGLSVALLAPDGAGKSTLADSLTRDKILRARLIYMGSNLKAANILLPTTKPLKDFIKSPGFNKLGPAKYAVKAVNYANRVMDQWYRLGVAYTYKSKGNFVVFDRYVYDSYLAPKAKSIGKKMRRWLLRGTSPDPDLVVLLDAPGEVLFARKGEHSPEILNRQRQVFHSLKDKISNMEIIDATKNAEEVRRQVIALIWKQYSSKLNGKEMNGRLR